jgi:hypothetical protein
LPLPLRCLPNPAQTRVLPAPACEEVIYKAAKFHLQLHYYIYYLPESPPIITAGVALVKKQKTTKTTLFRERDNSGVGGHGFCF